MDGKHILIKQPRNSGSYFFNCKGLFSIVLLALVDVNYSFIYVDARSKGRSSAGGLSKNSSLVRAIGRNKLKLPPDRVIVEGMDPLPYVMVADDPFSLRNDLMKPYPFRNLSREKIVFIYRLSRARRVVEIAFSILANRFRIFLSPMEISQENVEKVTLASCVLHNFLRKKSPLRYTPAGCFDSEDIEPGRIIRGSWRLNGADESIHSVNVVGSNNHSQNCKEIRENYCEYFNTTG